MEKIINGFRIAVTDIGEGPPLLFVHGYPLSRKIWDPQAQGLPASARVIAPDLRGHGDSDPVPGPYSMDLLAEDLAALLDELAVQEKVILCGLSMGGYVAFAFVRKFPERTRALILTATRAAEDSPQAKTGRDQTAEIARTQGITPVVSGMLPKMFAPQTLTSNPDLVENVRSIMMSVSLEGMLGDLAGMKTRSDSRPLLKDIKMPVLVIHGEEDQIIPIAEAKEMKAAIPDARFLMVPGAGHLLNLEQPALFNSAVSEFLADLSTKGKA